MSTEEDTANKEQPQTYDKRKCHYRSSDLETLCKSHAYFPQELRGQKDRDSLLPNLPLGYLCSNPAACWPWLLDAASLSLPQFKTRGWEDRSCLTQFSQFCARLWRRAYESMLLCDFERPCACWSSLTNGSVWSAGCRSLKRRGNGRSGAFPPSWTVKKFHHLFPARVSVSSGQTESQVCLFYPGRNMWFWFDTLLAHSCVYQGGIWKT